MSEQEGAELVGHLKRKKMDHGRFENPWNTKVLCWVKQGVLYVKPVVQSNSKGSFRGQEAFDLARWKVDKVDKNKFSIVGEGSVSGPEVRLRAETEEERSLWEHKLSSARGDALNRAKLTEKVKAMKAAEQLLSLPAEDTHRKKQAAPAEGEKQGGGGVGGATPPGASAPQQQQQQQQ
eukprot:CAMPEP_0181294140 /NCGR_PEP_ID=MMETSP1101-20121128/3436_1 /TAXON_ID=46948 /ORGANISM="Rhodomonas abbreviata, Strain Caron Lab Isolate" /LENGTH=177 /DNA_ID=CAMNT_0023398767 /DNA_START=129 /DNA_END=659 /DNA_ORIENTATION=-